MQLKPAQREVTEHWWRDWHRQDKGRKGRFRKHLTLRFFSSRRVFIFLEQQLFIHISVVQKVYAVRFLVPLVTQASGTSNDGNTLLYDSLKRL